MEFLPSFLRRLFVGKTSGGVEDCRLFSLAIYFKRYLACSAGVFGRAKAACLCSYCCNCYLCYDGGRLGRVKIVTIRVGARAKEGKRGGEGPPTPLLSNRPIFSPLFEFQHALSRAKNSRARRKRLHCRLKGTFSRFYRNVYSC